MTPAEADDLAKKIIERLDKGKVGKGRQPPQMRANIARLIEQETRPKPPYHTALETLCVQMAGGMSVAMVRGHLEPIFASMQSVVEWLSELPDNQELCTVSGEDVDAKVKDLLRHLEVRR